MPVLQIARHHSASQTWLRFKWLRTTVVLEDVKPSTSHISVAHWVCHWIRRLKLDNLDNLGKLIGMLYVCVFDICMGERNGV